MLKGSLRNSYRNANGRKMYVFNVSGSAKELEQYKEVQGNNYREDKDTQVPLFFLSATDPNGNVNPNIDKSILLTITGGDNPRVVVDSTQTEVDALRKAKELVPQELAKQMALSMFGGARSGGATVQATVTQPNESNTSVPVVEDKTVADLEAANAAAQGSENL